jgi:hypothetical protein
MASRLAGGIYPLSDESFSRRSHGSSALRSGQCQFPITGVSVSCHPVWFETEKRNQPLAVMKKGISQDPGAVSIGVEQVAVLYQLARQQHLRMHLRAWRVAQSI